MISLTRLNGKILAVNSDLIKFIEQSPDTFITLVTDEKIVVRESVEEVRTRIMEFRRSVLQHHSDVGNTPTLQASLSHAAATEDCAPEKE